MWTVGFVFSLALLIAVFLVPPIRRFSLIGITLVGFWMTTGAFFLSPWVTFSPWRYGGNVTLNQAMDVVLPLVDQIRGVLPTVINWLPSLTSLYGVSEIVAMPTLRMGVRLTMVLVPVVGGVSGLLALFATFVPYRNVRMYLGGFQVLLALVSLVMLVGHLHAFDSWGAVGNFPVNLIPVLLGAEIGWGVWAAFFGLIVLLAGGVWMIGGVETSSSEEEEEYHDLF